MQTIELTLEDIRERLRKGYVYSGKSLDDSYKFMYSEKDDLYLTLRSKGLYLLREPMVDVFINRCLSFYGELYELEEPTLEEE